MKSADKSSMNLYSMFYMKSNLAVPSLFIINTARKLHFKINNKKVITCEVP